MNVHKTNPKSMNKAIIKGSGVWERLKKMGAQAVLIYHHCANSFHPMTLHLLHLDFSDWEECEECKKLFNCPIFQGHGHRVSWSWT